MGVHPPPSPGWANFSIMVEWKRQKVDIAALWVLCGIYDPVSGIKKEHTKMEIQRPKPQFFFITFYVFSSQL
jgi:hypothetical protein